jgi:hypothetical protein
MALAADARLLIAGCADGSVSCWEHATDTRWVRRWTSHAAGDEVTSIAASASVGRIAVVAADGSIALLEPAMGERLMTLAAAPGAVRAACFAQDAGALVLSSSLFECQSFEAGPPACGLLRRDAVSVAIDLVDGLLKQLWTRERVLTRLRTDAQVPGANTALLEAAIQVALARIDPATYLNSEALIAVIPHDAEAAGAAKAVVILEAICKEAPESYSYRNSLALAYYRAGQYDECLRAVSECLALRKAERRPIHPTDLLVQALAERKQAGAPATSGAEAFAQAKKEIESQSLRGEYQTECLLKEAEQLLGGASERVP